MFFNWFRLPSPLSGPTIVSLIWVKSITKSFTTLEASDVYPGYPESGQDIRMIVIIPAIYGVDNDVEREWTEIDFGNFVMPNSIMPNSIKTV